MSEKVKISIKGAGISYEAEIGPLVAANILRICVVGANQPEANQIANNIHLDVHPEGNLSLGEFVHKHQPTSYPEKMVAIAAYLKEFKGKDIFSPEDIRPSFRTIGDIPPANFGRDFRIAMTKTWIARDGEDHNSYYITNAGLNALNSNFSNITSAIKKHRKKAKTKNKS